MNKSVFFSVIVPIYNNEKYLPRCIDSILSQTFYDFELILVDDGSTDNSGLICDEYAEKDKRIHVYHKSNGGVSSARNLGLDNAVGKYVVFIDSDDYLDSNYLESFVYCESVDIIIVGYVIEDENGEIVAEKRYNYDTFTNNQFADAFVSGLFNYVWGKAFRKSVITRSFAHFDERLNVSEDTVFVVDVLSKVQKICVLESQGYHYIKYSHETLTNRFSMIELIDSIEASNEVIFEHTIPIFNTESSRNVTMRIGKFYSQIICELINREEVKKTFMRNLFSKKWFRKTLQYADEIYCDESAKFRALLKTKSYLLVYTYLKHFR